MKGEKINMFFRKIKNEIGEIRDSLWLHREASITRDKKLEERIIDLESKVDLLKLNSVCLSDMKVIFEELSRKEQNYGRKVYESHSESDKIRSDDRRGQSRRLAFKTIPVNGKGIHRRVFKKLQKNRRVDLRYDDDETGVRQSANGYGKRGRTR